MRGGVITGTAVAGEPQGALTLLRARIAARTADPAAADEQLG